MSFSQILLNRLILKNSVNKVALLHVKKAYSLMLVPSRKEPATRTKQDAGGGGASRVGLDDLEKRKVTCQSGILINRLLCLTVLQ